MLDDLPPLETTPSLFAGDTFDALLANAIDAIPDNDEATRAIFAYVRETLQNGEVDVAIQQAMILGATACMHPHLEDLANELGEEVFGSTEVQGDHAHAHNDDAGRHNSKKSKRRERVSASLSELLSKYTFFPKSTGQK